MRTSSHYRYDSCTCRSCRFYSNSSYRCEDDVYRSHRTTKDSSSYSPTYGSYIYPARTRRSSNSHPRSCDCNCCSHSSVPERGGYTYASSSPRRDSYDHNYKDAYQRAAAGNWWSPSRYSSYTSYGRSYYPDNSSAPRPRSRSWSWHEPEPLPADYSGHQYRSRRSTNGSIGGRSLIEVVDRATDSSLRRRHGRVFMLSLASYACVDDVLDFLTPDSRRHRVMVHWEDGSVELLDDLIPLHEVRRYATQLEVRDAKKRVHFS